PNSTVKSPNSTPASSIWAKCFTSKTLMNRSKSAESMKASRDCHSLSVYQDFLPLLEHFVELRRARSFLADEVGSLTSAPSPKSEDTNHEKHSDCNGPARPCYSCQVRATRRRGRLAAVSWSRWAGSRLG